MIHSADHSLRSGASDSQPRKIIHSAQVQQTVCSADHTLRSDAADSLPRKKIITLRSGSADSLLRRIIHSARADQTLCSGGPCTLLRRIRYFCFAPQVQILCSGGLDLLFRGTRYDATAEKKEQCLLTETCPLVSAIGNR